MRKQALFIFTALSSCFCFSAENTTTSNKLNVPAGQSDTKINLETDFILWNRTSVKDQMLGDGIGLTFDSATGLNTVTNVSSRGSTYSPTFGYKPGVKVTLGLTLPYDGWDLEASYAWLHLDGSTHFDIDRAKGWQQTYFYWQDNITPILVSNAKDHRTLSLNLIDLSLGKKFSISRWLLLRPHIGILVTYIPHREKVIYNYTTSGTPAERKTITYKGNGHGTGCGALVGIDTEWRLANHWSLLGDFSLANLYTALKTHTEINLFNLNTGVTTQNMLSSVSMSQMQFVSFLFLGIDWHTHMKSNRYFLSVQAGWDFINGFQNQLVASLSGRIVDAFGVQGFRFGINFNW